MTVTFAIGNRVSTNLDDQMSGRELAARCRRRLWPEPRNVDPEVPPEFSARFYSFGPDRVPPAADCRASSSRGARR